ncbi:MAG: aminoacetone oxidase family FAD-binding enzyme [Bacilli bacterium]|nr:aminoacetone oxidase family FAD-binding enzyme [Bacilli bacterium]
MKIGIIGGGASGVFAAIRIKELHPNYDVTIFERNDKLLKKIYATGNGRCNFANSNSIEGAYNNDFALPILKDFDYLAIDKYFDSIGIKSRKLDNLYYPYSLSAATVAEKFLKRINVLKIKFVLNAKIDNYTKNKEITVNDTKYTFDMLIFACGGKSSSQFGTDGNVYSLLEEHGYKIEKLSPSLCPIKVKENVNKLDGVRAKAKVYLLSNGKEVYNEVGEVQFRSDALSGIVIFNIAFMINKFNLQANTTSIKIDFVPEVDKRINKEEYNSYLNEKLSSYLVKNNIDIHNAIFAFKSFYTFDISHVSSGGVSLDEISTNLESKKEKGIYFIGEVLDIDAKCGGYNLMWAFASAEKVAKSI